jgi:hypothetical protein
MGAEESPMSDVTVVGSSRAALRGKLGVETHPAAAGLDARRALQLGLGLGLGIAFRPTVRAGLIWVFAQAFGGILASGATDPNSGPLLALLALTYWPARPGSYWPVRPAMAGAAVPIAPPAAAEGNLGR